MIPDIVKKIPLKDLIRIDVALEGDWNSTVVPVWTREDGFLGFSKIKKMSHEAFKPSIELYFKNSWIGIHCFKRISNENIFNKDFAMEIVEYVQEKEINKK